VKQASNVLNARNRYILHQTLIVGLTMLGAIIVTIPIIWMVNASIRPIKEVLAYPPKFISENFTLEYFIALVDNEQYRSYFYNSCVLALSVLTLTVSLGMLAAYGFSRFKMRGGKAMLLGIMALLMLPSVTLIIPYFRLAHILDVYDTLPALILVDTAFILPICTWLLKGYIDSIPVELEEAAMIDGCTRLQALWKILIPLTVPGLVGTGTFVFIFAWNEYLLAVTMTESPAAQPLTVGLAAFFGQFVRDWNSIMALTSLTSIPLMLIFVLFQRWVVQGMTSGAVK
jgi:multiple sugar transport system permease protein